MALMTPTTHKKAMKAWVECMRNLRNEVRRARMLRTTGRVIDREDAEGILIMAWHEHKHLQAKLRALNTADIQKFSHVSPAAAARLQNKP